jgi:hypothetical protein
MGDTDHLKGASVSGAHSACDMIEALIKAYAPFKDQHPNAVFIYLILQDHLQRFRRFKTAFEGFILPTPDEDEDNYLILAILNRIRGDIHRIRWDIDRIRLDIDRLEQKVSSHSIPIASSLQDFLCSPRMVVSITKSLDILIAEFQMAEKIISSDQATLKLLELEGIPEFFDTISDRAHLPPLKHQGLGDRELESNDTESSKDKAPVHGSDESHLTFDSESKDKQDHLPPTDYLFSETEMWKTSLPKRIHANKKGADQSKDLTMELADFGFGEEEERRVAPLELGITWPDSWGTKPIEKGSEGYKSFDSRDFSSSVVETCKICNSRREPVGGPCPECAERERHFLEFLLQESSEWPREGDFPGTKPWWAPDESQKLPDSQGHASEAVGSVNDSDQDSTKAEDSESDMSNPPSVFSLATLPSTIMTTDTRLTVDEMQAAMEELVSIFLDDTEMAVLYREAIIERQISPQNFVRNFRRLIKQFALNLKKEAQEAIDFDLSKLISMRARLIADKIGNKLELKYLNESPTHLPLSRLFPLPTPWIMESLRFHPMAQSSLPEDMLDSSSDEDGEQPAETFTALVSHGRSFILESAAIKNLRKELENFIITNGPMIGADMDLKFEISGMSACIAFRNSTQLWGFPLKDMDIKIDFGISEIKGGIVFRRSTRLWGFPLIDMAATRAKFRARGMERYWYWNKFFQLCSGEDHLPEKHTRFRWTNVSLFPSASLFQRC